MRATEAALSVGLELLSASRSDTNCLSAHRPMSTLDLRKTSAESGMNYSQAKSLFKMIEIPIPV